MAWHWLESGSTVRNAVRTIDKTVAEIGIMVTTPIRPDNTALAGPISMYHKSGYFVEALRTIDDEWSRPLAHAGHRHDARRRPPTHNT